MAHDDDHRKPRMEDWGVLNAMPDPPAEELDLVPRRRAQPPEQRAPDSLLPDPDLLVDVPIKSHRSYSGLIFLLLIGLAGGGLYFVMKTDHEKRKDQAPAPGINLGIAPSLTSGAAPDDVQIAPPPKKTLLRIETDPPGAQVVVNGNPRTGETPTAVQTFVGQPVRAHIYLEGHRPVMKELTITGTEETLKVALEKTEVETGTLEIASDPPGAFITYGGVVVGEAPFTLENVPGDHPVFFRLQLEGHEAHVVRYEVPAGSTRRVGVRMVPVDPDGERTMATVTVESDPLVASIDRIVGGTADREGTTGSRPVQVFARIGYPLVLEATARNHGTDGAAIDVIDPNYTVLMRLPPPKKVYGSVELKGSKKLTVYLDGEELDPLPLKKREIRVGEHELVIVDPETKTKSKVKFAVAEGEEVVRTIQLTDDGRIVVE